jgi:hypothetical protein
MRNATKYISLIGILAAGALQAQEVAPFSVNVGAGFNEPIGTFGRYNDIGWTVQGGVGMNFGQWVSLMLDADFNNMGINRTTLDSFGVPGGTDRIWSFTLDPQVHVLRTHRFDVYLTGGGGLYRLDQQLTAPGSGFVATPFGGFPTFGNIVVSNYSINRPGFDAGAGINLGTAWRAKFYAEARYNRIYTSYGMTDYIPVTFGVRF